METLVEDIRRLGHAWLPRFIRDAAWTGMNLAASVRALGAIGGLRLARASHDTTPGRTSEFSVYGHPFWIRHGGSDANVLIQSAFRHAYAPWMPPGAAPKWILDLGANIGDSAVWFLNRFPTATVLSLEPEPSNYELACRNLAPYGDRAIVLQAAIWPSDGGVRVTADRETMAGSVVSGSGQTDCDAVSMPTLMTRYGISHVDIFKCDIEGAEEFLFADGAPWLADVDHVCIELHDENCRAVFRKAAVPFGFSERAYREVHVFRRSWAQRSRDRQSADGSSA